MATPEGSGGSWSTVEIDDHDHEFHYTILIETIKFQETTSQFFYIFELIHERILIAKRAHRVRCEALFVFTDFSVYVEANNSGYVETYIDNFHYVLSRHKNNVPWDLGTKISEDII